MARSIKSIQLTISPLMINPPLPPLAQLPIKLIIKRHIHPLGMFLLPRQFRFFYCQLLIRQIMGVLPSGEANDFAFAVSKVSVSMLLFFSFSLGVMKLVGLFPRLRNQARKKEKTLRLTLLEKIDRRKPRNSERGGGEFTESINKIKRKKENHTPPSPPAPPQPPPLSKTVPHKHASAPKGEESISAFPHTAPAPASRLSIAPLTDLARRPRGIFA